MGRVRTKTVKKASRRIIEKYYTKLGLDFYRQLVKKKSVPKLETELINFSVFTWKLPTARFRFRCRFWAFFELSSHTNARIVDEVAIVPTKHLKNQIAGFITHTMKRIQKGPVRGISIKLQEEERERRDNYVPEQSALCEPLELDDTTTEMLKAIDLKIEDAQN